MLVLPPRWDQHTDIYSWLIEFSVLIEHGTREQQREIRFGVWQLKSILYMAVRPKVRVQSPAQSETKWKEHAITARRKKFQQRKTILGNKNLWHVWKLRRKETNQYKDNTKTSLSRITFGPAQIRSRPFAQSGSDPIMLEIGSVRIRSMLISGKQWWAR